MAYSVETETDIIKHLQPELAEQLRAERIIFGFTTPDGRPKQRYPGVIPPKRAPNPSPEPAQTGTSK